MLRFVTMILLATIFNSNALAEDSDTRESVILKNIYPYPLTYREKPIGHQENPHGYQEAPLGVNDKSYGAVDVPLNWREKPADQLEAARGFRENPWNFIEKDKHPQVKQDPDYLIDTTTHTAANNSSSLRIALDNRRSSGSDAPAASAVSAVS